MHTSGSVEIAFEIDGAGDPIVFLHGITESRASWKTIIELLSSDYQVIRVDLRGHGSSGRGPDYHPRALASDVQTVIREIGIGSPHLVGHSLGGATATFVAAMYGARSVTNIDQPMNLDSLVPLLRPMESPLRGPEFTETLQGLLAGLEGEKLSAPVRRELLAYHQNARKDVVLGCWDLIFSQAPESLAAMVDDILTRVRTPYWSLHGSGPGTQYESWLRQRVPSAIVEVWPCLGHWLHRVEPDRFVERLREFLRLHT